jgi:hypothetical protein
MNELTWRASTYSSGQGGNCVEVAAREDGSHVVRDSKDRSGPVLTVANTEWTAFVDGVRDRTFD